MPVEYQLRSGCQFLYIYGEDEPVDTLEMAARVALTAAECEAIRTGQDHIVARLISPRGYTVFPAAHRALEGSRIVPA